MISFHILYSCRKDCSKKSIIRMSSKLSHTEGRNVFEDLSGSPSSHLSNPYVSLIQACENDPVCGEPKWKLRPTKS